MSWGLRLTTSAKIDLMFKRLTSKETICFTFDGVEIKAQHGDTVAAALLASGTVTIRTTQTSKPRGPYCMMGACYDCLVQVDGRTVQSCMLQATPDLLVNRIKKIDE